MQMPVLDLQQCNNPGKPQMSTPTTTTPATTNATANKRAPYQNDILAGRLKPGMTFQQRVWAITRRIPSGRVLTYGDIARKLGTKAYRAVGQALNANPYAPQVPCHRVVGARGQLTGFASGLKMKKQLLDREGVTLSSNNNIDLKKYRHHL